MSYHCPIDLLQVGDHEEKLAEGIKLYALPTTATSKRTILGDLIMVCTSLPILLEFYLILLELMLCLGPV